MWSTARANNWYWLHCVSRSPQFWYIDVYSINTGQTWAQFSVFPTYNLSKARSVQHPAPAQFYRCVSFGSNEFAFNSGAKKQPKHTPQSHQLSQHQTALGRVSPKAVSTWEPNRVNISSPLPSDSIWTSKKQEASVTKIRIPAMNHRLKLRLTEISFENVSFNVQVGKFEDLEFPWISRNFFRHSNMDQQIWYHNH